MWHIFPFREVLSCKEEPLFCSFCLVTVVLFMDIVLCGTVPPDSCSMSVITDKLILSSNQDVIFPACYTLLSGIKSINLKDLLRSVEIFMWSQMSSQVIVRWINLKMLHIFVFFGHFSVQKWHWPGYCAESQLFKPLLCSYSAGSVLSFIVAQPTLYKYWCRRILCFHSDINLDLILMPANRSLFYALK